MRKTMLAAALMAAFGSQAATLIQAGRLIDGTGKLLTEQTVVVDGDKISAVKAGYVAPGPGDKVIDLKGATLMPGLIDAHVHLSFQPGPNSYAEGTHFNPADYALRAVGLAKTTLEAGFTTVRDVGDVDNVSLSLRDAINKGEIEGPRIYAAGKIISTTGGHGDPTDGLSWALMGDPGPAQGVINGPIEARKAVRQHYKDGTDLIKITATGGVLSVERSGQNPQFMDDELQAIVATAKDYGMKVAVHAHGKEGMLRAIHAGVDSIEHGTYMDDEVMRAMKKAGTWYVPTIIAGKTVAANAEIAGYYPEMVRPKALAIGPQIEKTFSRAVKAGLKIAFGTDAGVYPHGQNAREFQYMVEGGMSPMQAILCATRNASELLGVDDELGSVSPGKLADLVAVQGDPLQDIKLMQKVSFVMKAGVLVKGP
ncbi:amidohydrolase family protein [Gallaecimonas kandeliae]|uniref:metal-dependent hydrolase family protein n=1 Tax=Gallaecimonas kandeliae TaxID=3029055 RepID=UPI002649CADF|nr:amidohydrolase family protein [Gallaecimonas kandeliae]WKE65434.1 amidohydrolase family protein [Gallaecimonas kandeliae]